MVDRTHKHLHPVFSDKLTKLEDICFTQSYLATENEGGPVREFATRTTFRVFETYRTPERQSELFATGIYTKAPAGTSAHQYGLAADFAVWSPEGENGENETWAWPDDADWSWLKAAANSVGLLIPVKWDRGHVIDPLWLKLRRTLRHTPINDKAQHRKA